MNKTPHSLPQEPSIVEYEKASCDYYSAGTCLSCALLGITDRSRLSHKLSVVHSALDSYGVTPQTVHPIVIPQHPWQSRHKIKMAVHGSESVPLVGITKADGSGVDLVNCPLTPSPVRALLAYLRSVISSHRLTPYSIANRNGELKHIIIMLTADASQAIVRFVLRSSEAIPRIRKAIASIQSAFPWVKVISCNMQPLPAAILEGPEEVILTESRTIREDCAGVPLHLSPQSFMQVTPQVAHQLYATAARLAAAYNPALVLDLFCGVGGFSLHLAPHAKSVIGVELTPTAIDCARTSAAELRLNNAQFYSADVDIFLASNQELKPDMVVANPPRRGLSASLIDQILLRQPETIVYSSCAPETFARDAQMLKSRYTLTELTPFDMFPMTTHCEVLGVFKLT